MSSPSLGLDCSYKNLRHILACIKEDIASLVVSFVGCAIFRPRFSGTYIGTQLITSMAKTYKLLLMNDIIMNYIIRLFNFYIKNNIIINTTKKQIEQKIS